MKAKVCVYQVNWVTGLKIANYLYIFYEMPQWKKYNTAAFKIPEISV